ncbi:hypothetical protein QFI91_12850 [Raoultella sp. WB_B2P2-3]|uniref:hypothetical protein n=1 Tax=Raoultella scottii TaxID=3040937 RepID=UPI002F935A37
MRTLLFLAAGFLLAGLCRLLVRLSLPLYPSAPGTFSILFALLWFGLSAGNMILGVTRAGYSFQEELPIFLLIFLPPVLAAFWCSGK